MAEVKDILASMGIDLDTKRFELKLRAIAKHTEALADELDVIDSSDCSNLSVKQIELLQHMLELNQRKGMTICSCDVTRVLEMDDELLTRSEGSD